MHDPENERQRLIVRIEDCAPDGFLTPIPYVDLVPLLSDASAVREPVLGAVDPARHPEAADFAALHRRSGTPILHPEVRGASGGAFLRGRWRHGGWRGHTCRGSGLEAELPCAPVRRVGVGVGRIGRRRNPPSDS